MTHGIIKTVMGTVDHQASGGGVFAQARFFPLGEDS